MIEPAALKKPVVTGPELFNFAEISASLREAGGMVTVRAAADLAAVLVQWFSDPVSANAVGERGFSVVEQNRGALAKQLAAVCGVLDSGGEQKCRTE
jgi:3-deoxy-D-manno-octulosonic-acid transferase